MGEYDERPWQWRYQVGKHPDITLEHSDALSMWRAGAGQPGFGQTPFLHYFGAPVTAAGVDGDSDALAAALMARGLGRGDRIALYLQNMPQFVVSLLAAWKLGAIAVPVNPMLKERELRYVLRDSGARALISLQDLWNDVAARVVDDTDVEIAITTSPLDYLGKPGVPGPMGPIKAPVGEEVPSVLAGVSQVATPGAVDLRELVIASTGARPAPVTLGPDDTALLTYTSGTTGEPKGATNTHGNVAFNACVYRDWMSLTPGDVVLAGAPLFHITGLIGHVAVAMLTPMPMVLGYRFEPATMLRLAERYRCTYTVMAITAFTALMNDPSLPDTDLSALTKVYSGGAPIAPSIVERFEAEAGPYIHNIYGLTETTSPCHAVPFGRRAPVDPASGALSIGVPVFNTTARIVDDSGTELPVGETGEIAVRGPMVVPGYWNRPDATAATLPDGELRTGDVGFMDPDGWFYLVDRKKDMIVASGYKVWPREVEDTLLRHPCVREAAVVGVPDSYRGETVRAYVSLRSSPAGPVSEEELIDFCRGELAAYKYPRSIEIVDDLPKTPTGKLLRRELRGRAAGRQLPDRPKLSDQVMDRPPLLSYGAAMASLEMADEVTRLFDLRSGPARDLGGQAAAVADACHAMAVRFHRGGKLVTFGTGGASADAQHVAVEFVHPVIVGKRALPAISLTTDVATVTGIAERDGVAEIFSRQIRRVGQPGDIALGISPGGDSPSVAAGLEAAKELGMLTVALAGSALPGGHRGLITSSPAVDHPLVAASGDHRVVKETHVTMYHVLWELVHVFFEQPGVLA